jgi:hypothetical protein
VCCVSESATQYEIRDTSVSHFFEGEKMTAQSTITKGAPPNFKNVSTTPAHLLLISSLTHLDQFFAELGTPATDPTHPPRVEGLPALDQGMAISKKPQLEFLAPPEVGPYR